MKAALAKLDVTMNNMAPLINVLWRYLALEQPLKKADYLLVLGSNDIRVAETAASLFLQGWAKRVIFSGGFGRLSQGVFTQPEAQVFADIAMQKGVPQSAIIIEPRASNTGDNIQFCQQLLHSKGLPAHSALLLTKPYLQRRAYATCKKQWPTLAVTSAPHSFNANNYPNRVITGQAMHEAMLGEIQRIMEYPSKGFMAEQAIPESVISAYRELAGLGGG
ncbi:YdcF family protein [Marinagarivorans cellulosilyticus]|uniref:DUF218 domain-containing protein n=1 Tax=Marinagarivorans cellulosilyticus TaxID=2721545 RepID=A0AAN2BLZ9_9GAMM|nr:YdcF family protein [Marinagarivorans cellulosilyticus]BCD99663.1 hypothetical protein MARGE09_P3865 [Marinagarivorans cellulosilyticus]